MDEPTNKLDLEGVRSVRQLIAELNREQGVTIILTTHVMEEAEELCGEIALLREGHLVAHQPTAALTRSLGLARPITVTLRQGEQLPAGWEAEVSTLAGVTAVADGAPARATPVDGQGPSAPEFGVESVDLRATTPALLGWLRTHHLSLVSMRAEPVTLDDVFMALAERRLGIGEGRR